MEPWSPTKRTEVRRPVKQALLFSRGLGGASLAARQDAKASTAADLCVSARGEVSVKELIKQYLDQGMSRRQLVSGLSALGMSTVAAKSVAQNLAPLGQSGPSADAPSAVRDAEGTGGALFVAQLKAAGV